MRVKDAWEIARSEWNFRDPAEVDNYKVAAPARLLPVRIGMMTTTVTTGRDVFTFKRKFINIETAGASFPAIEISCEPYAWRKIYEV